MGCNSVNKKRNIAVNNNQKSINQNFIYNTINTKQSNNIKEQSIDISKLPNNNLNVNQIGDINRYNDITTGVETFENIDT